MPADVPYDAAWVPDDDPERPWDDAAVVCVEWTLDQADKRGIAPLLVTPTQSQWECGARAVVEMAHRFDATTPRSKQRRTASPRAVLAYVPDWEAVDIAVCAARGGTLAVVETESYPLSGWAAEAAALNLMTGSVSGAALAETHRADLEHLSFVGNNGWADNYGKEAAVRTLQTMKAKGGLDAGVILGFMIAAGHAGRRVERLSKLIDRVAAGSDRTTAGRPR
ncbi:MAG TPA: hypothetical protein VG650_11680 [Mycobacteriales bacterium]|nr:hypothetical protein [Mycobacteriales bacterium]